MGYRLDKQCGVHPLVDQEFERNRVSVLACLSDKRYAGVAAEFEQAHQKLEDGHKVALDAANQFLNGLSAWVNAAHPYRHGQKLEEPVTAPLEFAVAMVSSGAAYIRFLVTLDALANAQTGSE